MYKIKCGIVFNFDFLHSRELIKRLFWAQCVRHAILQLTAYLVPAAKILIHIKRWYGFDPESIAPAKQGKKKKDSELHIELLLEYSKQILKMKTESCSRESADLSNYMRLGTLWLSLAYTMLLEKIWQFVH